ncbi:hypothetical protein THAOC_34894, partial [Thalassiosira oceanica]
AMGAVIEAPGRAMEELDSPYRRCAGRADRARQGAVVALQMRRATYAQGRSSGRGRVPRLRLRAWRAMTTHRELVSARKSPHGAQRPGAAEREAPVDGQEGEKMNVKL